MFTCWLFAEDFKKYGFDPILDKFVSEINLQQSVGLDASITVNGEELTVYANLCQVTCDNLALNGLLGDTESFSSDFLYVLLCNTRNDPKQHQR